MMEAGVSWLGEEHKVYFCKPATSAIQVLEIIKQLSVGWRQSIKCVLQFSSFCFTGCEDAEAGGCWLTTEHQVCACTPSVFALEVVKKMKQLSVGWRQSMRYMSAIQQFLLYRL